MDKLVINIRRWTIIHRYLDTILVVIGMVGVLSGIYFIAREVLSDDSKAMGLIYISYVIVAVIIVFCYAKKMGIKKHLVQSGEIINARFSRDEFCFVTAQ